MYTENDEEDFIKQLRKTPGIIKTSKTSLKTQNFKI